MNADRIRDRSVANALQLDGPGVVTCCTQDASSRTRTGALPKSRNQNPVP